MSIMRSRSLPDSEATDQPADLNDFISSRSGISGDNASGKNTKIMAVEKNIKSKQKANPEPIGFVEILPHTKRKEIGNYRQRSPLIKLTPFPEEQRRAMLSETLKTGEDKLLEFVLDEPVAFDRIPQERSSQGTILSPVVVESTKRRKSMPCTAKTSKVRSVRKRSLAQDELHMEAIHRRNLRHQESIDRVTHYLDHQHQEHECVDEDLEFPYSDQEKAESRLHEKSTFPETTATDLINRGVQEDNVALSSQPDVKLLMPEKPEEVVTKRRSSLRRRREDPAEAVVKDAQEETIKKTVRICSVEEEIHIERFDSVDTDEWIPFADLEEVQLVTAKIFTAEEIADKISRHEASLRDPLREEIAAISQTTIDNSTNSQFHPAVILKPSISENTLSGSRVDDNKVSEKNIKPEILMDLSRVSSEPIDGKREQCLFDDELLTVIKPKRKLSRVSSDSACIPASEVKFYVGSSGCFDEELPSIRHSQVDLVTCGLEDIVRSTSVISPLRASETELTPLVGGKSGGVSATVGKIEERVNEELAKKWKSVEDIPSTKSRQELPTRLRRTSSDTSTLRQLEKDSRLKPVDQRLRNRSVSDALVPKEEPPPVFIEDSKLTVVEYDGRRGTGNDTEDVLLDDGLTGRQRWLAYDNFVGADAISPAPTNEFDPETLDYSSTQSLLSTSYKSYGSPKREVQTQTQGEHKYTQYELEDLAEYVGDLYHRGSDSRERLEFLLEARFGSPRREVEVQTEQECKAVQCISEELAASGEFGPFFRRQPSFGSPRREAQVQTGQDTKSTQCNLEDFQWLSEERLEHQEPLDWDPFVNKDKRAVECSSLSLESLSPGISLPQRRAPPLIVLVKGGAKADMTVTHRDKDGNVVWAKHWGPERLVEIYREHQASLGLSIVGGKVDLQDSSSSSASQNVSGIFIKNVIPNSPAGRSGGLQTGDRIIEVDGIDLRNSTHERAVKAIQAAGNPVRLLVQSLVHLSPEHEGPTQDRDVGGGGGGGGHRATSRRQSTRQRMSIDGVAPGMPASCFRNRSGSPSRSPEVIQEGRPELRKQFTGGMSDEAGPSGRRSSMKKSMRKRAPSPPSGSGTIREVSEEREDKSKPATTEPPKNKYSSDESSEEEDTREMEGNVYTKSGIEISRKSAGNVKRSKEEIAADPEEEDEFGYTTNKVKKKYSNLKKPVFLVKLEKDRRGLGISLAGHKDRNKMAVFICGLNPSGIAFKNGEIQVGDELLEVNGTVFQGRCHLNASSMIKGMAATTFKLVVVRRPSGIENCAVKQVLQFPSALAGEDYSQFKGVRAVPIKKGTYGLGIMIIEGKHAEVGQGIFVSDIQVGSAAEQAGLNVGDMILSVNADTVMGATYDEATSLLKKAEGIVTLTVCNPNQSKVAEEEERKARGEPIKSANEVEKETEKPKEPEAPADPKDCKIINNKDTTIEFPKDKDKPIGFSVIGGNDTPLNGVFVLDVFTDGAAGKDGRLHPGDRIIDINKESFKSVEQDKAYQTVLRITQGPIIMIVHRDEKAVEEFEIELTKKSGKGSGLCLIGYKSGKGAYVSEVVAGGSAAESGKIVKGDRIVAVGGQDLREAPVEDIALHVKVSNPVQLKLARYKSK